MSSEKSNFKTTGRDKLETHNQNKKPSDYWGALTDAGSIFLIYSNLSKTTYETMLFLFQEVGSDGMYNGTVNNIYTDIKRRLKSDKYMQASKNKPTSSLSRQSVYNAIVKLEDNKIIYKIPGKYQFFVNPLIYYKGGNRARKGLVKQLLLLENIPVDTDVSQEDIDKAVRRLGLPMIDPMLLSIRVIDWMKLVFGLPSIITNGSRADFKCSGRFLLGVILIIPF